MWNDPNYMLVKEAKCEIISGYEIPKYMIWVNNDHGNFIDVNRMAMTIALMYGWMAIL